ncbi:MAG: hypothetical protein ACSLE8_21160 [Rhodococcus sp. (in: high G+C Gram-positive bacteria)]
MKETISVTLIPDEDGYVGRECPPCHRYFKVRLGTGLHGQDTAYCPYCGATNKPSAFLTHDQLEYAKSTALQRVQHELLAPLQNLQNLNSTAGMLSISVTVKEADVTAERYQERSLETSVTCDRCMLDYKIYGVFATCPDCGTHNSRTIMRANLSLLRSQLDTADESRLADILGNTVASFDAFGRTTTEHELGTRINFQSLDGAEKNLQKHNRSLRAHATREEWDFLTTSFQKRHVIAHNLGVADQEYLDRAHDPDAILGRKIRLTRSEVERTIDILERLSENFASATPPPAPLPTRPARHKNPYQLSSDALRLAILLHEKDDTGLPTVAMSYDDAKNAIGLDNLHFDAALRELDDYQLVKQQHRWLSATPYLPIALIDTIDYAPSEDDRAVAQAAVDADEEVSGDDLATRIGISTRRLNHAVRRLGDSDVVKVNKAIGTAPYAFRTIRATGATLRYLNS